MVGREGGKEGRKKGGVRSSMPESNHPPNLLTFHTSLPSFAFIFVLSVECEKRYWAAPKTERTGAVCFCSTDMRSPLRRENMKA